MFLFVSFALVLFCISAISKSLQITISPLLSSFFETISIKFIKMSSRTIEVIENDLEQENKIMFVHQKNGNYGDAEKSRVKIESLEKEHDERELFEMHQRHKKEMSDLLKSNQDALSAFNDFWNKNEDDINNEAKQKEKEMQERHKNEQNETLKELEVQYSPKVKESSQLLNLRKMEEHMVKQKIFAEAQKVQAQIFDLEKQEKISWTLKRNERIEIALNTLKAKQSVELANLKMKYKNMLDQSITDRKIEEERLLQKHDNLIKDLGSQQDKEILNNKGQFRSKGGRDSPLRTRSSFTNG